jgi:hypothetical protein
VAGKTILVPMKMRIAITWLILSSLISLSAHGFEHPGILSSRAELEFMKAKVAAGEQPWKDALEKMQAKPEAALDFKATPHEEVDCGSASKPDLGCTDEKRDSQAAYLHALLWAATGDVRYAKKSAEILHAWSILKGHGLSNAHLESGWTGGPFLRAAEILRYTYPQWDKSANAEFTTMINRAFLPMVKDPQQPSTNGNWEAVMMETTMSIAVYEDDQKLFDSAVARYRRLLPAFIYGVEDGPVPLTVDPKFYDTHEKIVKHWYGQEKMFDGLAQETGRDLTHTQWGLGGLIQTAEIAWHQGVDLYGERKNRLLRGMEFHAKYLNGAPVPADLCGGRLRGTVVSPMWEIGFNHYHNRMKLPMPETEKLLEKHRPEVGPDHHVGFGTLTHYGE